MLPQQHPAAFPALAAIAEETAVWIVERPVDHWDPNELAAVLAEEA